ncbi:MAG TPA: rhodanese-like domain-containing protein [Thermomicrobiales bacterium]|nr:rhodanese-like domain-containing protein [Thermomicrobiales bacterium]
MNVPCTLSRRALLGIAASGLAARALGLSGCGSDDQPPVGMPATASYLSDDLLVDAAWLAQRIDDPATRVIDSSPASVYRDGHIPGASHLWWQDTIEVNNPTYGMLTGVETRRRLMHEAGIDEGATVIVYDDDGGTFAARALWMLHAMSFAGTRLLDGGSQAWTRAGHELTRESVSRQSGALEGAHTEDVYAHAHDIEGWIGRDDLAILDTRTRQERVETWHDRLRTGRIPGSAWLPRDRFHAESGSPYLASRSDLIERLAMAGVAPGVPEVVVYGLHSTLAALPYVALRALGTPRVRVYDGAWAEWGAGERSIEPL